VMVDEVAELAAPVVASALGRPHVTHGFGLVVAPYRVALAAAAASRLWDAVGCKPRRTGAATTTSISTVTQRDAVSSMATVCNPVVLSAAMPTPDGIRLIAFAAVPSGQQPDRAANLANVSTTAINNGRRLPGGCCAVRLRVRTVARPAAGGVGQQPIAPRPRQLF
jgi:hypothetical protein